jgi:hypothetical protein
VVDCPIMFDEDQQQTHSIVMQDFRRGRRSLPNKRTDTELGARKGGAHRAWSFCHAAKPSSFSPVATILSAPLRASSAKPRAFRLLRAVGFSSAPAKRA